jgi:hypothetical protein
VNKTTANEAELRKMLFLVHSGDPGSNRRGQIGRYPGSFNVKYVPVQRSILAKTSGQICVNLEKLNEYILKTYEKLLGSDVLFAKLVGIHFKREVDEEEVSMRNRRYRELTFDCKRSKSIGSYEIDLRTKTIKYCFELLQVKESFEFSVESFVKLDGKIDRSRLDWLLLSKLYKLPSMQQLSEQSRKTELLDLFSVLSVKYKETLRLDYLHKTVENFLRTSSVIE